MPKIRSTILWVVWIFLTSVFATTLNSEGWWGLCRGLLFVADIVVLFFAEGFEVSAIDLSDKDAAPLAGSVEGRYLLEVQTDLQPCLANRQIFVAVAITVATLLTTFSALQVPLLGVVSAPELLTFFPLSYVTLSVLWFSQVPPKLVAAADPEEFFHRSRSLWPIVKAISRLGLPDPGAQIARLIGWYFRHHHSSTPLAPRIKMYLDCRIGRWVITWRSEGSKWPALSIKRKARIKKPCAK